MERPGVDVLEQGLDAGMPAGPGPRRRRGLRVLVLTGCVLVLLALAGVVGLVTSGPRPVEPRSEASPPAARDATWEDRFGTFTARTTRGTGDGEVFVPEAATAGVITVRRVAGGPVAVFLVDAAGDEVGLVTNGDLATDLDVFGLWPERPRPARLTVRGTGSWVVTVAPFSSTPLLGEGASGSGPAVLRYGGPAADWRLVHPGAGEFSVVQGSGRVALPNEAVRATGRYDGVAAFDPAPSVVVVRSTGPWRIERP